MANRLTFRSEINEWSADGFVRALETLPARSSCDVYLSTPGGEIYAGGEMINAVHAAMKRGVKFNIEVGSICASMGAALLAAAKAAGARVEVHPNTEAMFHGCWSLIVGGADELTDQAKAMRDFNATVKADLAKLGITDTDEWFAADRQKWLNAQELVDLGLADAILETAAEDPDSKEDALKIAASLNHKESKMETPEQTNETPVETVAEAPAPEAVETPTETPAEEPVEAPAPVETAEDIEARATALANERFAGLQSAHDKMISDLKADRDAARAELDSVKAELTTLRADAEKLKESHAKEIETLRAQLAQSEANREAVVVSALERPAEEFVGDPRAHLASLPPNQRAAFYKAHAAEIDKH